MTKTATLFELPKRAKTKELEQELLSKNVSQQIIDALNNVHQEELNTALMTKYRELVKAHEELLQLLANFASTPAIIKCNEEHETAINEALLRHDGPSSILKINKTHIVALKQALLDEDHWAHLATMIKPTPIRVEPKAVPIKIPTQRVPFSEKLDKKISVCSLKSGFSIGRSEFSLHNQNKSNQHATPGSTPPEDSLISNSVIALTKVS